MEFYWRWFPQTVFLSPKHGLILSLAILKSETYFSFHHQGSSSQKRVWEIILIGNSSSSCIIIFNHFIFIFIYIFILFIKPSTTLRNILANFIWVLTRGWEPLLQRIIIKKKDFFVLFFLPKFMWKSNYVSLTPLPIDVLPCYHIACSCTSRVYINAFTK